MSPRVVSAAEWLAARKELQAAEEEAIRALGQIAARRREMPAVKIEKDYVFEGPDGEASLLDLFEGRTQLIVQHFMFDPAWDEGCPVCSYQADNVGDLAHLHSRNTTYAAVSRAPISKIEPFRQRMGWAFPWYSSLGSDFNYDFHVTIDESVVPSNTTSGPRRSWPTGASPGRPGPASMAASAFSSGTATPCCVPGQASPVIQLFCETDILLDLTPLGRQDEASNCATTTATTSSRTGRMRG